MSNHPVHEYFVFTAENKKNTCKLCKVQMSGNHAENLMRHLKRKHENAHQEVLTKKKKKSTDENNNVQLPITEFIRSTPRNSNQTETIKISKSDLIDACVEMVTKNGRPLKMLEDSGFRKLVDPICKGLGVHVNRQNIRDEIIERSQKLRSNITNSIKKRILSVKVDCVSRLERSIIGINIQYCAEGKIQVVTLAMKEIYVHHTSINLTNIILEVLQGYEISLDKIYTITVDNAANMVRTGHLLNNLLYDQHKKADCLKESDPEEPSDDLNDFEEPSISNIDTNLSNDFITTIRCSSHTLNLAVCDLLKHISPIREKVRTVAKKLRTPTLLNLLTTKNLHKPILDCVTRWGSTYKMFKRILELKDFCCQSSKDIKELYIADSDWLEIENICDLLSPVYDMSQILQRADLTASDFFFAWHSCKIKVEKKCGVHSIVFANALKKRGELLLSNPPILACVYLDPRYQILLSNTEKKVAKNHLMIIYNKINNINDSSISRDSPNSVSEDEVEIISKQLNYQDAIQSKKQVTVANFIDMFDGVKRISKDKNIFEFWQNHHNDDLRKIAEVVLSVPSTQVSVERAFSTLKFVLSDLRASIDESLLEYILLLNLN